MTSSRGIQKDSIEYYQGSYAANHWALKRRELDSPDVIALAYFKNSEYVVEANSVDKRGYRSCIWLINNQDMASSFNRDFSTEERIGLGLVTQLVAEVYSHIVPIAQTASVGNAAYERKSGKISLGTEKNPSTLACSVFGRGNPKEEYIEGVKLDGPALGQYFNLIASEPGVPGNNAYVAWKGDEKKKVIQRLRVEIEKSKGGYEKIGLSVLTGLKKEKDE